MGADGLFVGVLILCAVIVSTSSFPAASTTSISSKADADSGLLTSAGTSSSRLERINERVRQLLAKIKDHHQERNGKVAKLLAEVLAYTDRLRLAQPVDQAAVADEIDSDDSDRKEDEDMVDVASGTKRASAAWDMDYGWGGGRFGKRRDRLGLAGRFGRSAPQ